MEKFNCLLKKFLQYVTVETGGINNSLKYIIFSNQRKDIFVPILYKEFRVLKKSWWYRLIEAPIPILKSLQKNLLLILYKVFTLPEFITAFRPFYSLKDNAKFHVKKKYIIKIDLKNFFHYVTNKKIEEYFSSLNYNKAEIDKLLSIITYKWRLPQGAPTSPFISNLIFLKVDEVIINLLAHYLKNWFDYTRYADDIAISTNNDKIFSLLDIIIEEIIPLYWYKVNKNKVKILKQWQRQIVTGLVVNEKVSIPRYKYDLIKAMTFNFIFKGKGEERVINWHLGFLKSVDKERYNKLKEKISVKVKKYGNDDIVKRYRILFRI